MATRIVVGGILLAADEKLGMEELAVGPRADLIDGGGVEIDEDGTRNVFAVASFREEGLEGPGIADILGIRLRAAVDPKAVLEEISVSQSAEAGPELQAVKD